MIPASLMAREWCLPQQVQGTFKDKVGCSRWLGDGEQPPVVCEDRQWQLPAVARNLQLPELDQERGRSFRAGGLRRDLERVPFHPHDKGQSPKASTLPSHYHWLLALAEKAHSYSTPIYPLLLNPKQNRNLAGTSPSRDQSCTKARPCFLWPPQDPHPRRSPRSAAGAARGSPSPSA